MKRIIFLLSLVVLFAACRVTLVPVHDPVLYVELTRLQSNFTSFYDNMSANTDKTFTTHEPEYVTIENEISDIVAKEVARPKNGDMITQSKLMQSGFLKFESEHKAVGSIGADKIKVYKKYILDYLQPLMVYELKTKSVK